MLLVAVFHFETEMTSIGLLDRTKNFGAMVLFRSIIHVQKLFKAEITDLA